MYLFASEREDLENTSSEFSQNRTEKQIMLFKTTVSWLFNDIRRYLVIGCFDLKIGVLQHAIVMVYASVIRQKGKSQNRCFKNRG